MSQHPAHWPSIFIETCVRPDVSKLHGVLNLSVFLALPGSVLSYTVSFVFQGHLSHESCESCVSQKNSFRVESHVLFIKTCGRSCELRWSKERQRLKQLSERQRQRQTEQKPQWQRAPYPKRYPDVTSTQEHREEERRVLHHTVWRSTSVCQSPTCQSGKCLQYRITRTSNKVAECILKMWHTARSNHCDGSNAIRLQTGQLRHQECKAENPPHGVRRERKPAN